MLSFLPLGAHLLCYAALRQATLKVTFLRLKAMARRSLFHPSFARVTKLALPAPSQCENLPLCQSSHNYEQRHHGKLAA